MRQHLYSSLPTSPGVYIFKGKIGRVLYIGKANNLKSRVRSYFQNFERLGPKTQKLVSQIRDLSHIVVQSEIEALLLEANLIKKYRPKYNVDFKDGKFYPFIKIATAEDYPRVIATRHIEKDQAKYFGPYPDVSTMRYLLRILRRLFPYCSCKSHPKSCLYHEIGLCPLPEHKIDKIFYRKTIKRIINFLEGKMGKVIKELRKEMKTMAKKENFEEAEKIKERIQKIMELTTPKISPTEYLKNPNLLADIRSQEIENLQKILKLNVKPVRIECYDISNIHGKEATGAMVVFINGESEKKEYRRFKIKSQNTPDDIAMLKEIFIRRFKNSQWPKSDLIVVDGGKAQLSAIEEVQNKFNLSIKSIALAKREEEIYKKEGGIFTKIILPKDSPALKLLMRLRDEAHRFAKKYHHFLRTKNFLPLLE